MTPKATSTFTQRQPARELVILTQQLRCELPRLFRADTLALLLHGSWALGLATPISDVDVLRIVDPAVSTRKNPEIISVGGRYVHVDIGTFDALRPERLEEVLGKQIFDTNDITTRLSTAIVLAEQERAGRLLVDEFRSWSPPQSLRRKIIVEALGFLNDAVGNHELGRPDVTELCLRALGASLAKLNLLCAGCTYVAPKWQPEMVNRYVPTSVGDFRLLMGLDKAEAGDRIDAGRVWLRSSAVASGVAR